MTNLCGFSQKIVCSLVAVLKPLYGQSGFKLESDLMTELIHFAATSLTDGSWGCCPQDDKVWLGLVKREYVKFYVSR